MTFALLSILFLCFIAKAVVTERRLLSHAHEEAEHHQETDSDAHCHCGTFAAVASEFCTDENLEADSFEEVCFEVQDFINVGLGLFSQAAACHLELCHSQDLQFFQDLCADLKAGNLDEACAVAETTYDDGRRRLHHLRGCFDEHSQVVLNGGSPITIQDVLPGSWIQTCERGVFTPVLAKVDHQQDGVPMKELHFQNAPSLVLTASHMVYSKDGLIPAYAVQPGTFVDGQMVLSVANVTGHPSNVVTLRQDIMVNGMCATWLTEEFMPTAKLQFLWDQMNHVAVFFPSIVFASTQMIADFFVPLLDDGTIGINSILVVMFSTGLLLFCTSAAMVMSFYAVLHILLLGQWSHKN